MHGWRRRMLSVGLLPLILVSACGKDSGRPPNLLLITVDTLRPDRLGYEGHSRPTTPHLDRLAGEGIVFTRAHSQSGWTLPSMATILTGRYPKDHKATDFHFHLDRDLPTLASLLKERGYDTRGYVSHVLLTPKYGLDKGFSRFDHSVLDRGNPHDIITSGALTALALRDLRDLREPFFVWIHYFDPHFAYLPHPQWRSFGDGDIDRYDQEIAYTDSCIGGLLDAFRQKKHDARTFVVFTADHGEEFGEHGGEYHETCYDEVLRVPLIFRGPGLNPGKRDDAVDQVDLLPTMLHLLGLPGPSPLPGRDILAPQLEEAPIYIERDRPPGFRQRALVHEGWKLIRVETRDTTLIPPESRGEYSEVHNVVEGTYLYDLAGDPSERKNRIAEETPRAEAMLARLARHFLGRALPGETVVVDQETRERLRSLGYIR